MDRRPAGARAGLSAACACGCRLDCRRRRRGLRCSWSLASGTAKSGFHWLPPSGRLAGEGAAGRRQDPRSEGLGALLRRPARLHLRRAGTRPERPGLAVGRRPRRLPCWPLGLLRSPPEDGGRRSSGGDLSPPSKTRDRAGARLSPAASRIPIGWTIRLPAREFRGRFSSGLDPAAVPLGPPFQPFGGTPPGRFGANHGGRPPSPPA